MSAVAEDAPASSRPVHGPPSLMARANAASRFLGRTLAWGGDVRWRDGLAIALSAGALAGSALVVVNGLRENSNTFVILGAVTALLTVAGQFAIRREMLQRQAESRSYWFRSSPRGLAEVDAELQKLSHMKTEFASMVSHEFRTALTGIQGMSELINGGAMKPDEVLEYSGYIFKEAERINRLITDMLDLDRLEAGKMKLQMTPLDLSGVVEGVAVRSSVVSSHHTIRTELEANLPMVLGDSDRLGQGGTKLGSHASKDFPLGGRVLVSSHV